MKTQRPPEAQDIARALRPLFIRLQNLAQKDIGALDLLASEILCQTKRMNRAVLSNLEFARGLTKRCREWPSLVTVDRDFSQSVDSLPKAIQLGQMAQENYSGRQWSRKTPEVRAALFVRNCLIGHNVRLPAFNRRTAGEWWKAGFKFFQQEYGKDFENHPLFKAKYNTPINRRKAFESGKKFPAWVRWQIRSKMPQALRSIAPRA